MRWIVVLMALVAIGLGAATLARGEDAEPSGEQVAEKRLEILELQVSYLLEREEALTKYVTASLERARVLEAYLSKARAEGFTQAAVPWPSREALLDGLDQIARSMQEGIPLVTKEQVGLLKRVKQRQRLR